MIAEYLVTPGSHPLRGMGYLRELLNIKARAWRCWCGWQPHLERSKAVIRTAIESCQQRRKAVILGSGLLYDVPVAELSAAFREVQLVDIIHPPKSSWPAGLFQNLRPVTADVTGTAEDVFHMAKIAGATLPRTEPGLFLDDPEVDLVVSLNLLSQLPVVPTEHLTRAGVHSPDAIAAYGRWLIEAHLAYIQRFQCLVALITDMEKLTVDRAGAVVERSSALRGVPLPWWGEEWIWRLAPRPEADEDYSYYRRVVGIPNIKTLAQVETNLTFAG
jgi:hypothetical protein